MTATARAGIWKTWLVAGLSAAALAYAPAPARAGSDPGGHGARIAFTRTAVSLLSDEDSPLGEIWVMNGNGTHLRRLTYNDTYDLGAVWSPDGRTIAFYSIDPVAGPHVFLISARGGPQRPLNVEGPSRFPSWSAQGKIAFDNGGPTGGDIFVVNPDGSDLHQLTTSFGQRNIRPAWSPDGRQIAFVSRRSGNDDIYVMNADGSGVPRQLTSTPDADNAPAWSPDGRQIVFQRNVGGNIEIYTINADGTEPTRLTDYPGRDQDPDWSPDGRTIAFERDAEPIENKTFQVFVMLPDGTAVRKLTGRGYPHDQSENGHPGWRPAHVPEPIQLSEDPFTDPAAQHQSEVEPDTFAYGATWVTAFQIGLSRESGSNGIGFATSTNGGHHFVHGVLRGTTSQAGACGAELLPCYSSAADSSVAFDRRHHIWLISYLGVRTTLDGVQDVLVSRSHDGMHWDLPLPVATLDASLDKDWIVCDNSPSSSFYGNCYTQFNGPAPGFSLLMATSSDGGRTWGAPRTAGAGNAGQPVVQPGGRVVVPYFGLCAGLTELCATTSDDGGTSWTTPTPITARMSHATMPALRSPALPSAEVDGDGRIYLVWKDCRFEPPCTANGPNPGTANDLVLTTSDDGTHWSDVQRIPLDPVRSNRDHFLPGIGVDPTSAGSTARLALTYYFLPDARCTADTCELEVGFVSSTDGGQTWTQPVVLGNPMQLGWLAANRGRMAADYISTSVLNGGATVLPAFAAATPPDPDGTLHEAIYTVRERIR